MRVATVTALFFTAAVIVEAKEPPAYEKVLLVKMDSSTCGYAEKDGKTIAGEIFGTEGQHKNTGQLLCQEYVLQTDRVTYRIQPKDGKHRCSCRSVKPRNSGFIKTKCCSGFPKPTAKSANTLCSR